MIETLAPELEEAECDSTYDHRVLFLSGGWEQAGSEFRFRATIRVEKDGEADGAMYWQAIRIRNQPADYFATEWVRGSVQGRSVALDGYRVEPGLAATLYKIRLSGDGDAGTFGGMTCTPPYGWAGRIWGQYSFRNRTA